jgi:hypothetical protein
MLKKLFFTIVCIIALTACGQNNEPTASEPREDKSQNGNDNATEELFNVVDLVTNVEVAQKDKKLLFNISLENPTNDDVAVTFPSGQKYEIVIKNDLNEEIYRYSEGRAFTEAIVHETIPAGARLDFEEEWEIEKNINGGNFEVNVSLPITEVNGEAVEKNTFSDRETIEIKKPNNAFRNVEVEGANGKYTVIGEARVFEGSFFYTVEEGHEYIIEETNFSVKEGAPSWSPFTIEIDIPQEALPENATITLELYERSENDGKMTNVYYQKLEQLD